jgi:hypothetical protein
MKGFIKSMRREFIIARSAPGTDLSQFLYLVEESHANSVLQDQGYVR